MPSEQTKLLQDFSGGLNTLTAPDRLLPNMLPTMSNVWYDDGALQKKPGQLKTSTSGGGDTIWGRAWNGYTLHTSVFSSSQSLLIYGSNGVSKNFVFHVDASSPTLSTIMDTGGTGTATTAVASPNVSGAGTNWLTTAKPGALFIIGNTVGVIQTVTNDTALVLTGNFGALNTNVSYNITNGWPSANRVSFVDMNSKAWICGQGATSVSWDGSTQTFVPAFPSAAYSVSYSNYIFAANTSANPSRVFWSSVLDPTTWPAANFVDVSPNDGFPIVGMFLDGQSIVILKTNSAWKLTGQTFDPTNPTYTLTQIYAPPDFIINSPKSVQLLGNQSTGYGFIMLGQKGLYSYNGAGSIAKLFNFDIIRSEFATISAFNWGVIPTVTAEPSSIIVDGNYWLQVPYSLSSVSASDKELTYIIDKTGAVWRWQSTANGMISDFAYLAGTLYGVNSYSGGTTGLIQLNTGSSDAQTTAINGTMTTKVMEFQNQQRFGRCNIYFKKQSAGNLSFGYQIDEGGYTTTTIDMTSSPAGEGGTRTKSVDVVIGQVGRTIQFQISNNVAAQTFEIYGIQFDHRDMEN
jgi:hypothetical protein